MSEIHNREFPSFLLDDELYQFRSQIQGVLPVLREKLGSSTDKVSVQVAITFLEELQTQERVDLGTIERADSLLMAAGLKGYKFYIED